MHWRGFLILILIQLCGSCSRAERLSFKLLTVLIIGLWWLKSEETTGTVTLRMKFKKGNQKAWWRAGILTQATCHGEYSETSWTNFAHRVQWQNFCEWRPAAPAETKISELKNFGLQIFAWNANAPLHRNLEDRRRLKRLKSALFAIGIRSDRLSVC